jgi:hypothetical protein
MGWLVALLAVVAVLAIFWFFRGGLYARLFAPRHVADLADAGLQFRNGLRKRMEERPDSPAYGPAEYRSHEGVTVLCSIHRVEGRIVYHVSLSHESGAMAFAAGGRFLYLFAGALGVQDHLTAVAHTPVTHGIFNVAPDAHPGLAPDFEVPGSEAAARALADRAGRFLEGLVERGPLLRTEDEVLAAAGLLQRSDTA